MNLKQGQISLLTMCLRCLEGSDCEKEASCDECSGVACTRITSFNFEDNKEVALTCIPYDTRTFTRAHLEESGCRRVADREICVCYSRDYCNSASLSIPRTFLMSGAITLKKGGHEALSGKALTVRYSESTCIRSL
ncbi:hypothetical protein DICVIV_09949 [Dictyocaulus viviparus]|uniref:Uncharacterized protein n=1 Tax=Dictyocaulus viviparus TaxID=29172 RepID=A0A0D8XJK3_DICVI|nr:hypothetical protein DICVIV_09949 [Dictyocaulus viviparus]